MKIKKPIQWEYNPQPDITAFELAELLPLLFNPVIFEEQWDKLSAGVTRNLIRHMAAKPPVETETQDSAVTQVETLNESPAKPQDTPQ